MIKERIAEIARQAVDRGVLTREVKANEDAYLLYLKKVEEARISEAMDQQKMMNVTIAEEASPAMAPLTQKRLSYIFALMVGLVGGVGSGFLREFFDDSVKTAADVTSSTALPVLASIPEEDARGKNNGGTTRRRRTALSRLTAMYERYFGFAENPFRLTPDPHYLYLSESHKEALASLTVGGPSQDRFRGGARGGRHWQDYPVTTLPGATRSDGQDRRHSEYECGL